MIGRYLDALPEDARDRVLTAQDWRFGGGSYTENGASCLVGHAAGWYVNVEGRQVCTNRCPDTLASWDLLDGLDLGRTVWERFDKLCARVGLESAVRQGQRGPSPAIRELEQENAGLGRAVVAFLAKYDEGAAMSKMVNLFLAVCFLVGAWAMLDLSESGWYEGLALLFAMRAGGFASDAFGTADATPENDSDSGASVRQGET